MKTPQTPDDWRIARKAQAFDVLMQSIPCVNNPRGNPEAVERMLAILNDEDTGDEEPVSGPAEG